MGEHVLRTRRRTRLTAGQTLGIVFALMLMTGLAGLAWGMWDEVARNPGTYTGLSTRSGMPVFVRWSVATAMRIVDLQGLRSRSEHARLVAGGPQGTGYRSVEEAAPETDRRTPPPGSVKRQPPEAPTGNGEGNPPHPPEPEPPPPPPHAGEPEPPPPLPPVGPDKTLPKEPERPPTPGMDTETADLLEKADARYKTAWEYYLKSRPEAPAAGRRAATIEAAKCLKETQQLYLAVLARGVPGELRKEIEARVVEVQRAMYWTNKFRGI